MSDRGTLTEQQFWDDVSAKRLADKQTVQERGWRRKFAPLMVDHGWRTMINVIDRVIPKDRPLTTLEVGCAPGQKLLDLCAVTGYEPFGLEYASSGVEETRRTFERRGYDPDHVVHGDLFDESVPDRIGRRFDVVMSFGLIEHFEDPGLAIKRHIELLAPGGYLVIGIPNLVGLNLLSMWLLRREFIAQHNRAIMSVAAMNQLFRPHPIQHRYCGRVGFFQFYGRFSRREKSFRGLMARIANRMQSILNPLQNAIFLGRNVSWWSSPSLLYIGQKP